MRVVILTDAVLRHELLANTNAVPENIIWIDTVLQFQDHLDADAWIDLLFQKDHISVLKKFLPKTIIINSVVDTLGETDPSFIRINAWPTFLRSGIIEAAALLSEKKDTIERIFSLFNKKIQWLPDEPGFVTPRVICMIINEAFICLKQGVSSKNEIDVAMKLGTNYPYGPFEWAHKIGVDKIKSLLKKLSIHHERYTLFIN
jgi:3-hydroxybutyryl-CoA dehydrogenase